MNLIRRMIAAPLESRTARSARRLDIPMRALELMSSVATGLAMISLPALVSPGISGVGEAVAQTEIPTGARNERSTPRDSILPFSPAIARHDATTEPAPPVAVAKAILVRLGYNVGRLDDRITARFKAAVFQFQRARGLTVSGELDSPTLQALGLPRG